MFLLFSGFLTRRAGLVPARELRRIESGMRLVLGL